MRTARPLVAFLIIATFSGCPPQEESEVETPSEAKGETASGWAGRYEGTGISAELRDGDGGIEGTITKSGTTFTLTAQRDAEGDGLEGSFSSDGASFDLTLTREGDDVRLATGGTTYELKRFVPPNPLAQANPLVEPATTPTEGPVNPLGQGTPMSSPSAHPSETPTPSPTVTPSPAVVGVPADWQEWKHASGVRLRHPVGWTAQETEGGVMFTPPDQAKDAQGQPLELYLANAVPAGGVKRADSPEAIQFLEQQLKATFPAMSRKGQPAQLFGGRAIALDFSGTSPQGGVEVLARLYATITEDKVLILCAVGTAEPLRKRAQTVETLFSTFECKFEQTVDPRFVGYWRHTDSRTSGDFSMTTDEHLLLQADGRCFSGSKSMGGGPGTSVESGGDGGWEYEGRWSVENKRIVMQWSTGAVENYEVINDGSSMMFKMGGGTNKLWERVR